MSNYVNWNEFNAKKMTVFAPKKTEYALQDGTKGEKWHMKISYQYDNGVVGPLYVEYPEITTNGGIRAKPKTAAKGPYTEYSIVGKLNLANNKVNHHRDFYEQFNGPFVARMKEIALDNYDTIYNKKDKPDAREALLEGRIREPWYLGTDESGEPVEGTDPMSVMGLLSFDKVKTLWTDAAAEPLTEKDGTPLKWSRLMNVEMEFQPLVKFTEMVVSGPKAFFKAVTAIQSAIIPELPRRINSVSAQKPKSKEQASKFRSKFSAFLEDSSTTEAQEDSPKNLKEEDAVLEEEEEEVAPPPKKAVKKPEVAVPKKVVPKKEDAVEEEEEEEAPPKKAVKKTEVVVPKKPAPKKEPEPEEAEEEVEEEVEPEPEPEPVKPKPKFTIPGKKK
jgi:hypothetical protein